MLTRFARSAAINGWIKCNINHEMLAKMIFLNKNYKKKKGSKLSCVAFY